MAAKSTVTAVKNAAVKTTKLSLAAGAGLVANNYATEKFHNVLGVNERLAKVLVSAAVGIGLPFAMERFGKVGNIWTDGVAAGAGLRFSAELLKFLGQAEFAEMLNPLSGPREEVMELEVGSMQDFQNIQNMLAGGTVAGPQPSPSVPFDRNVVNVAPNANTMGIY